jgi:hypothetical protein
MAEISSNPPPLPRQRPVLVWVIAIFYWLSAGWTMLSFALIFSGLIPLNDAQKTYFDSQTLFDYGSTFLVGTANILGAIALFSLKRSAFPLFASAFGIGISLVIYQIFAKNWLEAVGGPGLVGAIIGWGISISIIIYSKRLITRGLLR